MESAATLFTFLTSFATWIFTTAGSALDMISENPVLLAFFVAALIPTGIQVIQSLKG